jgi:hypothetical protein
MITQHWKNGDYTKVIGALEKINDSAVSKDVISSTFAKGLKVKQLSVSNLLKLMPLATLLLQVKQEAYNLAGLNCMVAILL